MRSYPFDSITPFSLLCNNNFKCFFPLLNAKPAFSSGEFRWFAVYLNSLGVLFKLGASLAIGFVEAQILNVGKRNYGFSCGVY